MRTEWLVAEWLLDRVERRVLDIVPMFFVCSKTFYAKLKCNCKQKTALPNPKILPHSDGRQIRERPWPGLPSKASTMPEVSCCNPASASRPPGCPGKPTARCPRRATTSSSTPTSYGAQHTDLEWLIGPGEDSRPDPLVHRHSRHVRQRPVILPVRHTGTIRHWCPFMTTCIAAAALEDLFGLDHVACVYGWSMGALQAYHWAALFRTPLSGLSSIAASPPTAVHNQVFLRSLMATLEAAPQHIGTAAFPPNRRRQSGPSGGSMPPGHLARISIAPGCTWRTDRSRTWAPPTSNPS